MLIGRTGAFLAGLACSTMIATPAIARNARSLQDLVGARGSSGEREMMDRGFVYADGYTGRNSQHTFWWHKRDKDCVEVKTKNGRYALITDATRVDCDKPKKNGSGTGTAVAVVAGAALVAAIAAGASKSGHDKPATISDLNGLRASSADSELTARGFTWVDGFKTGETAYSIWWRAHSRQCVQMTVADGRAEDVRDIGTHPKCK